MGILGGATHAEPPDPGALPLPLLPALGRAEDHCLKASSGLCRPRKKVIWE